MFMGILHGIYLEKLIGSTSAGFSDLMVVSERIENYLKSGKIQNSVGPSNGVRKPFFGFAKKKEGEANNAPIAMGKGKAYQEPYQQVVIVESNPYQQ